MLSVTTSPAPNQTLAFFAAGAGVSVSSLLSVLRGVDAANPWSKAAASVGAWASASARARPSCKAPDIMDIIIIRGPFPSCVRASLRASGGGGRPKRFAASRPGTDVGPGMALLSTRAA